MKLQLPLQGIGKKPGIALTQRFGENPAIYAQFNLKGHNGLDWGAPLDTPVYAVADGYIIEAMDKDSGYGLRITQYIELEGKQYHIVYGHFHKLAFPTIVWDWQLRKYPVKKGQVIGYVDSTGFSSGNHLHLGIYEYSNGIKQHKDNGYQGALDPEPFFESIISNTGKETYIMSNTLFVHKAGTDEYGFYIPATSPEAIKDKALNYGVALENADGTVDFSKAKEVSGL